MSDDGMYVNDTDCIQGRVFEYTNINCGQSYNYNVTISNVVNSTTESGPISKCLVVYREATEYSHVLSNYSNFESFRSYMHRTIIIISTISDRNYL